MRITQISVFLENKKGRLSDVCSLIGNAGVNIRALTVAESSDYGILRIVVDKPRLLVDVLAGAGFVAKLTDIVAVEVPDRPGGLAGLLSILERHDMNVEYMYGFLEKSSNNALMVFRFDDPAAAIRILTAEGVKVVSEAELNGK
jgi:hypothetical protein